MPLSEECRNVFTLPVVFQEVASGLMMKDTSSLPHLLGMGP